MKKLERALIVFNPCKENARDLAREINHSLTEKYGLVCTMKQMDAGFCVDEICTPDIIFSIGGDGTVLSSARKLPEVPVMAVNMGRVGFITEITSDEWESAFKKYIDGFLETSPRLMLDLNVIREGISIKKFNCLNDAVISSLGISRLIYLDISVGEHSMGSYRADGIIISTPTGSTAYSVAAGGPILDPELDALIINPICPFSLSNRPIVVKASELIKIEVVKEQRTEVILTIDGQEVFNLLPSDIITLSKSDKKALIIKSDRRNFFDVLKAKLNWSGGT